MITAWLRDCTDSSHTAEQHSRCSPQQIAVYVFLQVKSVTQLGRFQLICRLGVSGDWWMAVQVGGTFWLTRLSRDREASVRVTALCLLAHLASPRAPATRRMLLQGWPEAGTALLKV